MKNLKKQIYNEALETVAVATYRQLEYDAWQVVWEECCERGYQSIKLKQLWLAMDE